MWVGMRGNGIIVYLRFLRTYFRYTTLIYKFTDEVSEEAGEDFFCNIQVRDYELSTCKTAGEYSLTESPFYYTAIISITRFNALYSSHLFSVTYCQIPFIAVVSGYCFHIASIPCYFYPRQPHSYLRLLLVRPGKIEGWGGEGKGR